MSNSKSEDTVTFAAESYYVKKSDGFVYYYWRIKGSDTWNIQKTTMKEVPAVELASPEPPQDTSLDLRQQFRTILEDTIYDVTALGSDTTAGQMKLISLFAEQQAKLLQVIDDEVIGKDSLEQDSWQVVKNKLRAEQRQALKKIKERYE